MDIKNGTCPKCNSTQIYVSHGNITAMMRSRGHAIMAKEGAFGHKYIMLQHYVCLDCQYLETYVKGAESIKKILDNWQPLNKTKRKNEG